MSLLRPLCVSVLLTGSPALAAAAAAEAEAETKLLLRLSGVPVGMVALSKRGNAYRYRSVHLITRLSEVERRERSADFALTAEGHDARTGKFPSSLFLWRRPERVGCVQALDELSRKQGPLCVVSTSAEHVTGTWLGETFQAQYDTQGELRALALGAAEFGRLDPGADLPPPPDLYGEGLPIEGDSGTLVLEPSAAVEAPATSGPAWQAKAARALAQRLHVSLRKRPGLTCLEVAREYQRLAQRQGAAVALVDGLHAAPHESRARPHAWVRVLVEEGRALDLDPTLLEPVMPSTHLPLSVGTREAAGRVWLDVFSGRRRVVRR